MPQRIANRISIPIVGKVYDNLVKDCDKRHRLIAGGRGKGASWSIARILIGEAMTTPLFTVCVREVQKTIEYSVKKLLSDTINNLGLDFFFRDTKSDITGLNGSKFVFVGLRDYNADNFKSFEGADRCWVAEAQSISRRSINILRPTIRKEGSIVWWDFNFRYDSDPVYLDYILNTDPNSKVLLLNWRDNPWFTKALQNEKDADFMRNEEEAKHIWDGVLRNMGDKFVCPTPLVYSAMKMEINHITLPLEVGADIAHQGGDEIVFYKRAGNKIIDSYYSRLQDTVKTYKDLKAFLGDKAVADLLANDGYTRITRINFGGNPSDKEHFDDCVTEMYFNLRDMLDQIDIPNDEELLNQLSQRKYDYINGKRGYEVVKIESKDKFKEHAHIMNASPDRADALVLAFYNPIEDSSFGFASLNHNYMG